MVDKGSEVTAPGRAASGTVAQFVGDALARLGVGHAFGVVGSGNFHVTNALRAAGVPFVAARHEGGATTMADAWARTTGSLAVVTVHQGCGLTNAMTGIAEAAKSRTPLLVLAADTGAAAVRSNFRIDQDALVRAVGAVPERVHTPTSAAADVVRAYRTAAESAKDPDFLLEVDHVRAWEAEHGPLPEGGWLFYRTGWDARSEDPGGLPQRRRDRPAHPGDLRRVRAVAGRRRRR